MAIRDYMGLDVSAFKRLYKESKKNNTNMKDRCYWSQQGENSYYCDGFMIIQFKDTSITQLAKIFDLAYDNMPGENKPAQDLAKIFNSFSPLDYNKAFVSKWSCEGKKVGKKEPGFTRLIVGEKSYCLINENFLAPFSGLALSIKSELAGIMFRWGFDDAMTAYILPVKPDKESTAIYKAIQEKVMRDMEGMKND